VLLVRREREDGEGDKTKTDCKKKRGLERIK
jgi:hypothetical protein